MLALQGADARIAPIVGAGVSLGGLLCYLYFHRQAAGYAFNRLRRDTCGPFNREQWEEHLADSLRDGNHDMITILALIGLIVFSAFEGLSGLGKVRQAAIWTCRRRSFREMDRWPTDC